MPAEIVTARACLVTLRWSSAPMPNVALGGLSNVDVRWRVRRRGVDEQEDR